METGRRQLAGGGACARVLLAALCFASCGADESLITTEEQFCVEFGRRECEKIGVVCGREVMQCQQTRAQACRTEAGNAKKLGRTFRSDRADTCLGTVSNTYDKKLIGAADWEALRAACGRVFEGNLKMNEACTADADCVAPLICDQRLRLCGQPDLVGAGDHCGNPGELCPADEYCRPATGFAMCTKRKELGTACSEAEPCAATLRCEQTCKERRRDGEACQRDAECRSGYCNLYMRAGSPPTCTLGLSFGTDSPACEAYFGVTPAPTADAAAPDASAAADASAAVDASASADAGAAD